MIQIRRGRTLSWLNARTRNLAAGQPGYDKDKHKIKIGDGTKSWAELPYASGLSNEDILSAETEAKARRALAKSNNPLASLASLLMESPAVITYGTENPDSNTVGQLYLQYYDANPEVDHIVEYGTQGIWTYRKWQSGIAECWGVYSIDTKIATQHTNKIIFTNNSSIDKQNYPITFKSKPKETASLQASGGLTWLGTTTENSTTETAIYKILSIDEQNTSASYKIAFEVKGRWK